MNNGYKNAYPVHGGAGDDPRNKILEGGLTKREMFAMAAMQGLIAGHPTQVHNQVQGATLAIVWADELLKQLES